MTSPPTPMHILIIGAGLAGLSAAIALRKQGHTITILEKSRFLQETGAAIHMGANISPILEHKLGFDLKANGAVHCTGLVNFTQDGTLKAKVDMENFTKHWRGRWLLMNRVDVHAELRRLALDLDSEGPVPELLLGVKLSTIDPVSGTVVLDSGRKFKGDVIIGADGNHSISRNMIEPAAHLVPWGKQCFRWLLPREPLLRDDETRELCENDGYFCAVSGDDRRVVLYPCRDNTVMNAAVFVPDEVARAREGETNKDVLERAFSEFGLATRKLIQHANAEDVKVWPLFTMDVMPKWHKDRLVLVGDAAHPFLPFLGMGGAIAMEDAVCLAILLQKGTPASEVPERLKLYNEIRHERATIVQYGSRVSGNDAGQIPEGFSQNAGLEHAHNFNEWENTTQKLQEWLAQRKEGSS